MIIPSNITAFVVDTATQETSETVQQAAFDAGYAWHSHPGSPPRFTEAPALVFGISRKWIVYSDVPKISKGRQGRITLTISQALKYFRELSGKDILDCTIPEED